MSTTTQKEQQPLHLTSLYAREVLGENPHAMDAEGREWWLDSPYGRLVLTDDRWVCITCGLHVDWPNERNWHYVANWHDPTSSDDDDRWAHDSPQCATLVYPRRFKRALQLQAPSGWDD